MRAVGPSQPIASISILLILLTPSASSDNPQTIASLDAYKLQRDCAQGCFWYSIGGGENSDGIADAISCKHGVSVGALDSCFCRLDLQPVAETYLSTCISVACSYGGGAVTVDISSAVSIYDNYCSAKGYVEPQSVSANTTPLGSDTGTSSTTLVTTISRGTSFPTSGSTPTFSPSTTTSTASSTDTGLSDGDKIALGVGLGIGIPTLIVTCVGAWYTYLGIKRRVRRNRIPSIPLETIPNNNSSSGSGAVSQDGTSQPPNRRF